MNKEFIPYEQALALKELGFDEPCFGWFRSTLIPSNFTEFFLETEFGMNESPSDWVNSNFLDEACSAPLYQQAFRWFREKYNLMFQIFYLCNGNYAVIIHRTTPEYMDLVDQINPSSGCVDEVVDCYSYEEAELACLVKLIEITNKTKYSSNDAPTWYN